MFERYTEKARRTIFFARYEASQTGSPVIGTEHLLLGLLRENHNLLGDAMAAAKFVEHFRLEITSDQTERVSTSVDLPLSHEAKRVLHYGAEEARQMGHSHIGTEHLFLGLLREGGSLLARLSREHGIEIEAVRQQVSNSDTHFKTANPPDDSPVDRNTLRGLIDSLPEAALMAARNTLMRMQTWPPELSPHLADLRRQRERLGLTGSMGGITDAWTSGAGGRHEGSRFRSYTEDGALIRESSIVFQGHEITLMERLKMSEDAKQLSYSQQLRGPKREHHIEIDFDLT